MDIYYTMPSQYFTIRAPAPREAAETYARDYRERTGAVVALLRRPGFAYKVIQRANGGGF